GQDYDPVVVYFPKDRLHAQFSRGDRVYLGMPRVEQSQPLPVDKALVRRWVTSPDWRYRQTAARLLWRENSEDSRRILKEMAERDPSAAVRLTAMADRKRT
ncbi:MAG: HEAT repeat domain-containing protein, partial [Bryobacterales bacterium]|nr:HEAT repeat domain-containing protein [Bryobacterales bacterium]